jgi:hypothetical protein
MLGLRNEHCVACLGLNGREGLASRTVHVFSQCQLFRLVNYSVKIRVEAALRLLIAAPQKRFLLVVQRNAVVIAAGNIYEEVLALSFNAMGA